MSRNIANISWEKYSIPQKEFDNGKRLILLMGIFEILPNVSHYV